MLNLPGNSDQVDRPIVTYGLKHIRLRSKDGPVLPTAVLTVTLGHALHTMLILFQAIIPREVLDDLLRWLSPLKMDVPCRDGCHAIMLSLDMQPGPKLAISVGGAPN